MRLDFRSFHKNAFSVSFFALLSYGVDYSYQLVDVYWVAKLGVGAPTAIVVVAAAFFLIFIFNNVVGISSVALISQAFGRDMKSGSGGEAGRVIFLTLVFKFVLGLVFVLIFWGFMRWGLGLYTSDSVELAFIRAYGGVLWVSLILLAVHTSCMTALRSIGEARVTLWVSLVAFSVNFVVNPVLIFGWWGAPALGIAGAAWATVLAQSLAIGLAVVGLLYNRAGVRVFRFAYLARDYLFDFGIYRKLLLIGLPALGMIFLHNFEQAFVAGIVAQHDSVVSDGFGIGARIYGLLFMLNFGVSLGLSVAVGQCIGRGESGVVFGALPRFLFWAALVCGILSAGVALFAGELVGLFSSHPVSVRVGAEYLRFMALTNVLVCVIYGFSGAFEGAGKNGPLLMVAVVMYVIVEFPLLWLFRSVAVGELYLLWLVMLFSAVVGALIVGWLFWKQKWMPTGT